MDTREKLILAGMKLLREKGYEGFTLRKTAAACGLSCSAPYKHFKNKNELIAGMIEYINSKWLERQSLIGIADIKKALVEISMEYIAFLRDNPLFYTVIVMTDSGAFPMSKELKYGISRQTDALISKYCAEKGLDDDRRRRKTFIVRSIIYGAALLRGMEYILDDAREAIEREFELG